MGVCLDLDRVVNQRALRPLLRERRVILDTDFGSEALGVVLRTASTLRLFIAS